MSTQSAHERVPAFTIGDRLRKAREKVGLDQAEFAHELGVSRGTVSNYERADCPASDLKKPYLLAWSLRTDVPIEWLESGKSLEGGPDGGGGEALRELTRSKLRSAKRHGAPNMDTRPYTRAA